LACSVSGKLELEFILIIFEKLHFHIKSHHFILDDEISNLFFIFKFKEEFKFERAKLISLSLVDKSALSKLAILSLFCIDDQE